MQCVQHWGSVLMSGKKNVRMPPKATNVAMARLLVPKGNALDERTSQALFVPDSSATVIPVIQPSDPASWRNLALAGAYQM